jgi:polysaccharide export outer membrane protein
MRSVTGLARPLVLIGAIILSGCSQAIVRHPAYRPAPAAGTARSFQLRPGDVVRLKVWREPELGGDFPVESDGRAVFPSVGPIQVLGVSRETLEATLVKGFGSFVKDPALTLQFIRRTPVGGAVRIPGLYPVDATMTVADVIALAGGVVTEGENDKAMVLRNGTYLYDDLSPSLFVSQLELEPGDVVQVPYRSWATRNVNTTATLVQIVVFTTLSIIQTVLILRK